MGIDLNTIWFILITILFTGFFFLEGFDYGVGILVPVIGKTDDEKRVILNTIGPHWDGNEVWMITAGGALFAAFPHVYATMFSGFYLALFCILVALIVRAVGIDYRSKRASATWRKTWDIAIAIVSILAAVLWGVAVGNLVTGVPIDENMQYAGSFFTLLTPFTLLTGVMFGLLFLYHGAVFLQLKVGEENLLDKINRLAPKLGVSMIVVTVIWVIFAFLTTGLFDKSINFFLCGLTAVTMILSVFLGIKKKFGWSFLMIGLAIAFATFAVFISLFPNIMISTLDPSYSLTIYNASSSAYTLRLMTIIAFTLVPVVLAYQAWSFYIYRKRVTKETIHY
jgi:cytochrome d ubiquinol oxidase, subunit II